MTLHSLSAEQVRREFGPIPFWFWNDELTEHELLRQIADFETHGVHGFVIHPRVGLPRRIAWMSDEWLHYVSVAVEEAARRGMSVVLYDEAMYPSGSSGGQIVASNPALQARCLDKIELSGDEPPDLARGWNLIAIHEKRDRQRIAVVDRPVDARIRGIHYVDDGPDEDEPLLADILNPEAVAQFVELVYEGYSRRLARFFGQTVIGIFTDEPNPLGRCDDAAVRPGTAGIVEHVSRLLGYDFAPHLAALWYDDDPDAQTKKADYLRAIRMRLDETYYRPLHDWCAEHGLALMGHPAGPGEMRHERYFQIPGQDVVWRWVLPGETSLEGPQSTSAKCASSAALHCGRRRNSVECFGGYSHEFTWEEMMWVANWCFIRGTNMLIPHAFYYSVRGPRKDERPPDVGPNSPWWGRYTEFANHCAMLSCLNTDSRHVCSVAILTDGFHLPWNAAEVCFQHQHDFNYLDAGDLLEDAHVSDQGIRIGQMLYGLLIVDGSHVPECVLGVVRKLATHGRVVFYGGQPSPRGAIGARLARTPAELVAALDSAVGGGIRTDSPEPGLRLRHVSKDRCEYYMLFNEGSAAIDCGATLDTNGACAWLDTSTWKETMPAGDLRIRLAPYEMRLLLVRR